MEVLRQIVEARGREAGFNLQQARENLLRLIGRALGADEDNDVALLAAICELTGANQFIFRGTGLSEGIELAQRAEVVAKLGLEPRTTEIAPIFDIIFSPLAGAPAVAPSKSSPKKKAVDKPEGRKAREATVSFRNREVVVRGIAGVLNSGLHGGVREVCRGIARKLPIKLAGDDKRLGGDCLYEALFSQVLEGGGFAGDVVAAITATLDGNPTTRPLAHLAEVFAANYRPRFLLTESDIVALLPDPAKAIMARAGCVWLVHVRGSKPTELGVGVLSDLRSSGNANEGREFSGTLTLPPSVRARAVPRSRMIAIAKEVHDGLVAVTPTTHDVIFSGESECETAMGQTAEGRVTSFRGTVSS